MSIINVGFKKEGVTSYMRLARNMPFSQVASEYFNKEGIEHNKEKIRFYFNTKEIKFDSNKTLNELGIMNMSYIEVILKIEFNNDKYTKLKEEFNKAIKIIEQQKIEIRNLKNKLNLNNNEYSKLINSLKSEITNKNNIINHLNQKLISLKKPPIDPNDLRAVNFISPEQNLQFAVPCSGNTIFAEVEEKLYQEFPEFRGTNNNFLANGSEILRFKTVNENKIGTGKPVILIRPS